MLWKTVVLVKLNRRPRKLVPKEWVICIQILTLFRNLVKIGCDSV